MAINFPDSPSTNDTHVVGDKTWTWNGTYWHVKQGVTVSSLVDGDSDTKIQVEESSDEDIIRFDTGGTERMAILANGKVGIGTASPSTALNVYVTGSTDGITLDGTTHPCVTLKGGGTVRGYIGIATGNGGFVTNSVTGDVILRSDSTKLHLGTGSGAAALTVSGTSVGIGTISPDRALHVAGTFRAVGDHDDNVLLESTGTGLGIIASHTGSGTPVPWDIREDSSTDHNSASYAPLWITRMNVTADGAGSNLQFRVKKNDGTAQEVGGLGATIDTGLTASATVTGSLHFYTTDAGTYRTEQMTIKSDGKVGIGTTSPTHKLHARGASFLLDGYLYLGDNASSVSSVWNLYSNSSNLFLNCASGSAHYIRVNNATAMVVNVNGISIGNGDGGAAAGTSIKAAGNIAANSTGTYPVVIGVGLTTNAANIGVGSQTLTAVTSGDNVAIGYYALRNCTTAGWQVAIGNYALGSMTTQSGHPNYAQYSTAVGHEALWGNVNGAGGNVAMGFRAGKGATTGLSNTFIGMQANQGASTGSNNTCLGYNSATTASTTSDEVTLGNSSISNLRCQDVTISQVSDERDKTNIQDLDMGLDFICRLQPRRFEWNMRDGGKVGVEETGFIAQELQQAMVDEGKVIPGLVRDDNPDKLEAAPMALFTTLVKAIQELSAKVDALT